MMSNPPPPHIHTHFKECLFMLLDLGLLQDLAASLSGAFAIDGILIK